MSTYTVQSVLDRRGKQKNQRQYLIKWKGYSLSDSTWQPMKNLIYVKQMIIDFDEQYDNQNQVKKLQTTSSGESDLKKRPLKALQIRKTNRGKAKKASNQDETKQTTRERKKQNIFKNTKSNFQAFSSEPQEQSIHSKFLATIHQEPLSTINSNLKLEEYEEKGDKVTEEGNNSKENKRELVQFKENSQQRLQILGMRKNEDGEYFFLVQSSTGLTSYKTRQYLVKNYPETLIIFYESKMVFVEDKNLH